MHCEKTPVASPCEWKYARAKRLNWMTSYFWNSTCSTNLQSTINNRLYRSGVRKPVSVTSQRSSTKCSVRMGMRSRICGGVVAVVATMITTCETYNVLLCKLHNRGWLLINVFSYIYVIISVKTYFITHTFSIWQCMTFFQEPPDESELNSAEMRMLRWARVKTRLAYVRNDYFRKVAHIKHVETYYGNRRLKWIGHCLRREHNHICAWD